jgi:Ca-activated chloride channel homolog
MSFGAANILWLLAVLPPSIVAFLWWSWRKRETLMALFIQARLLPGLVSGVSPLRRKIKYGCLIAAVACVILALARPQWGFTWQEVKQRGVDIVIAVDTSKSMLAEDIAPNRLARAKLAALDLMQLAKADRLGLVAFAGNAFLQCPLTIDDSAFRQSVESLDVSTLPEGGTALAEAIDAALTAFKEGDNYKVLVLMTDGEDHDSGALEAAQKAAKSGLRIFTIGIGTPEGELLRTKDDQGRTDYIRDEQGNVVKSHLNERLLQEIAGTSEGCFYLPLRGAKTIETLFEKGIAPLPKSEHQDKLVKQYHDRYHWPLGLGIALLILEMLLPERRREPRATPATASSTGRAKPAAVAAAVLLLLLWPLALQGSSSSALREYKDGQYDRALKDYEELLQRKTDDPRLHFNAGSAAYRSHQYDSAVKHFNDATSSPDLKLQQSAYYNRGNSMFRQGEEATDPAKRMEAWQKSLKDFDLSLKLNPQDTDAKFNHDFVKQRLEELKQQQQQQQKSDKNQSDQDKQDQQQQQQNQSQDQQQKDQNQQQQQQQGQQDQPNQKQDSSADQQKQDQQKQQQQQQQQSQANQGQDQKDKQSQAGQEQQQQQQQQESAAQAKKDAEEKQAEEQAAEAAGKMSQQQAQRLLDAQKGDEKMLPPRPQGKPKDPNRRIKDW